MKNARPVRLKDIAEELGLSVMAVSKALRGHADIGADTRRRVLDRASELKYRPNLLPRQMLTGRTRTIGMIVPALDSTYFAQVAHGVSSHLRERGYQLLLCNSEASTDEERRHAEALLAHQVDGVVLCPAGPLRKREELSYLLDSGVPCVLAARGRPAFPSNFVGSNGVALARAATEHLLDRGCRRVAHIRGPMVAGAIQRVEGYRQALESRGLRVRKALIAGDSDGIDAGHRAMCAILSKSPRPDGVFCYTDLTAGGAMMAIFEAGLRIPEDIAMAGVGNLQFTDMLRTPLTTIDQDPVRMGVEAATLITDLADGKSVKQPVARLVPFRLIVRESSFRA
jgi:LacI family transcriptional regulator